MIAAAIDADTGLPLAGINLYRFEIASSILKLGHDITAAGLSSHEYVATGNSTKAGIAGSDNTESSEDSADI